MAGPPAVKTLERALRVLLYLGTARRELSLGEIAGGVGLHPSTTHRFLSVLTRHGFTQGGAVRGHYALGLRLTELGYGALQSLEIRAKARPILERLSDATRETVHLMLLDGHTGVYVDRVESPQRIRVASSVGLREYLHCSAVGKAILAHLPPSRLAQVVARGLPRMTARTITEGGRLRRHLAEVARRGYAIDNEEGEPGIRCVGAPVFDHRASVIASVSIAGPAFRLPLAQLAAWGPRVVEAAMEISAAVGFRGRAGARRAAEPRRSRRAAASASRA